MPNFLDDVLNTVGEPWSGSQGFPAGTHKVAILEAEAIKDKKDRDVIKVIVCDPDNQDMQAEATLWFHTEGGAKMAVTKVMGLVVHSVGEEKKEAVKTLGKKVFASADTPTKAQAVALKLLNEKLIGKEAFLVVTPNGNYSTSKYGDLWHYPAEAQTQEPVVEGEVLPDDTELPDFGEEL